jgi:multidrug resistance efflux pump
VQASRDRLSAAKTQGELQMQQATQTLTQAQARYAQAKYNWEYANGTGNDPIVPDVTTATGKSENKLSDGQLENYYAQFVQAEAALRQAEKSVELAKVAYDSARQAEVTGVQAAEQQLRQAQLGLEKAKQPADRDRVAAAQAALAQAVAGRDRLNPNPRDSQKAQVAAGIAQAQAALELARINREHAELRAPFGGVVAVVNIDPGDPSSTGAVPAMQIVNVDKLHVDVQISDVDIGKVQPGQAAEVRVDAVKDTVFKGRVGYIAPTATSIGNIRTYLVRIELDEQTGLRDGMSAQVTIVEL